MSKTTPKRKHSAPITPPSSKKRKNDTPSSVTPRSRGRPRQAMGYLSSRDTRLSGMTVVQARKDVNDRIRSLLTTKMSQFQPFGYPIPHHKDHKPMNYQITVGERDFRNIGRWQQLCLNPTVECKCSIKYHNLPIQERDLMTDPEHEGLARLLIMREELMIKPRNHKKQLAAASRKTIAHSTFFDALCDRLQIPVADRIQKYTPPSSATPFVPFLDGESADLNSSDHDEPFPQQSSPTPVIGGPAPFPLARPHRNFNRALPDSISISNFTDSELEDDRNVQQALLDSVKTAYQFSSMASTSAAANTVYVELPDEDDSNSEPNLPKLVMVFIWIREAERFIEVAIEADDEDRINLSQCGIMAQRGIDMTQRLLLYSGRSAQWVSHPWDRRIGPFVQSGSAILLRYAEVNPDRLPMFKTVQPLAAHIEFRSKKGKDREM
ncbi:hypothetical protein BKA70DRAFT_1227630 [Coprinopsis sp. MPI-PUGE-AT-0042]|nr:hypothetical protein BKA70DRAFT_1227630 [Coprinopsis sp. MPI-PUGE-AT-0042]